MHPGLAFKRMLVLTRPWALPNFGLGLVVLQRHSLLPRMILHLVPGRTRNYRQGVLHERCICTLFDGDCVHIYNLIYVHSQDQQEVHVHQYITLPFCNTTKEVIRGC